MLRQLAYSAALAALLLARAPTLAQMAVPGVPAVPGAVAPTAAAPAAPAGAGNIWSKIMMTPEQKAACKAHWCNKPIVQLLGGMLAPVRAFSGGLLRRKCPGPLDANPADLLKPADSAEGAAAKIKKSEAEAKARRAAVRYLGTVDCNRYPEAEAALIGSLRGDPNECVRLEAALALGNRCCCTKKTIEALVDTVSCKKTNDPPETSPRVRAAAARALNRCLCCYREVGQGAEGQPEKGVAPPEPPAPPEKGVEPPSERELPPPLPAPEILEARRTLQQYRERATRLRPVPAPAPTAQFRPIAARVEGPAYTAPGPVAPPSGRRDVWSLLMYSVR